MTGASAREIREDLSRKVGFSMAGTRVWSTADRESLPPRRKISQPTVHTVMATVSSSSWQAKWTVHRVSLNVAIMSYIYYRTVRSNEAFKINWKWTNKSIKRTQITCIQYKQVCRSSILSDRNVCWPRRLLTPGESRTDRQIDRQTDGRTPHRYNTLSARHGLRNDIGRRRYKNNAVISESIQ